MKHQVRYIKVCLSLTIFISFLFLVLQSEGLSSSEFVYVSVPATGALYKIDSAQYKVVSKGTIGGNPIAIWAIAEKVFISDEGKPTLRVYDPAKRKVVHQTKVGNLSINGGHVWQDRWAFWAAPPGIVKVDAISQKVSGAVKLPEGNKAGGMDRAPNGKLYVTDGYRQKIYVIDPESLKLVTELSTQDRYLSIKIARDGKAYFTGSEKNWDAGDWIDVWDTSTNVLIERFNGLLPSGASFIDQGEGLISQQEMVITQDNRLIVIVHGPVARVNREPSPMLIAIDLAAKKVVWQVVGTSREDSATSLLLSREGEIFVTAKKDIKVVNAVDGKVKKTIPVVDSWGITSFVYEKGK